MTLWLIRNINRNADGKHPYWLGGRVKSWVDEFCLASRYSDEQKVHKEANQMPEHGAWIVLAPTYENFMIECERELTRLVIMGNGDFGHSGVKQRARDLVAAARAGEGTVEKPVRTVARKFGCDETPEGIRKLLNSPGFQ